MALFEQQEVIDNLETITDFIRWASSLFNQEKLYFGHGTENAVDEAAYLVLHTLHLPNNLHVDYFSAKLLKNEKQKLIDVLLERVTKRIPASYITHQANFAGLSFYVDERVLVPRSPISELIQKQFSPWVDAQQVFNILDLCTGSGCIAIACAYAFPQANIDAVDLSNDALDVARINLEKHHLSDTINLIQSDLFKAFEQDKNGTFQSKYDIIVSNPPYVDQEDMQSMPEEYLAEPEIGLAAGDDGLGLVIPMLQQARQYLSERGVLIVEVGNSDIALQDTFPDVPFYWLEFEQGGDGVFVLTKKQLESFF
ncbi:MAG: 50S ribosomal protein L3 N(5)-glutamine methyltransferase [Pseudomonadota bacterium]